VAAAVAAPPSGQRDNGGHVWCEVLTLNMLETLWICWSRRLPPAPHADPPGNCAPWCWTLVADREAQLKASEPRTEAHGNQCQADVLQFVPRLRITTSAGAVRTNKAASAWNTTRAAGTRGRTTLRTGSAALGRASCLRTVSRAFVERQVPPPGLILLKLQRRCATACQVYEGQTQFWG
jgi:hypothetical protein